MQVGMKTFTLLSNTQNHQVPIPELIHKENLNFNSTASSTE